MKVPQTLCIVIRERVPPRTTAYHRVLTVDFADAPRAQIRSVGNYPLRKYEGNCTDNLTSPILPLIQGSNRVKPASSFLAAKCPHPEGHSLRGIPQRSVAEVTTALSHGSKYTAQVTSITSVKHQNCLTSTTDPRERPRAFQSRSSSFDQVTLHTGSGLWKAWTGGLARDAH